MLIKVLKELLRGKTLARSLMNLKVSKYGLYGKVLDIGGGNSPSYLRFFKDNGFSLVSVDLIDDCNNTTINLETDTLPYKDKSMDSVLMFNLLEHIYNYSFSLGEASRVLKKNGRLIGFVPFLVGYHPDPSDYFRYTKESLNKIFKNSGFGEVKITEVGVGPFTTSFNLIIFIFPKILILLIYPICYLLDSIISMIRPELSKKFPLGYFFVLKK